MYSQRQIRRVQDAARDMGQSVGCYKRERIQGSSENGASDALANGVEISSHRNTLNDRWTIV